MRFRSYVAVVLLTAVSSASAQVASHGHNLMQNVPAQASDAGVVRVNNTILTQRDLVREMFAIFPYARVHNGFPKGQEEQIRRGALDMIVFEELVYQDAVRRKAFVSQQRVNTGLKNYRESFKNPVDFDKYLKVECQGSMNVLRARVRRALIIDDALKAQVDAKSIPTEAELRGYYDKNAAKFSHPAMFDIQSISIVPQAKEQPIAARKRAEEALQKAKASKSYEEFGLLAEKMSDDDFRVNMGHRKPASAQELPPPIVAALRGMTAGQVSGLIPLDDAYTIVRLVSHKGAGKQPYMEVKAALRTEAKERKRQQLRSELSKKLRSTAKIEML